MYWVRSYLRSRLLKLEWQTLAKQDDCTLRQENCGKFYPMFMFKCGFDRFQNPPVLLFSFIQTYNHFLLQTRLHTTGLFNGKRSWTEGGFPFSWLFLWVISRHVFNRPRKTLNFIHQSVWDHMCFNSKLSFQAQKIEMNLGKNRIWNFSGLSNFLKRHFKTFGYKKKNIHPNKLFCKSDLMIK